MFTLWSAEQATHFHGRWWQRRSLFHFISAGGRTHFSDTFIKNNCSKVHAFVSPWFALCESFLLTNVQTQLKLIHYLSAVHVHINTQGHNTPREYQMTQLEQTADCSPVLLGNSSQVIQETHILSSFYTSGALALLAAGKQQKSRCYLLTQGYKMCFFFFLVNGYTLKKNATPPHHTTVWTDMSHGGKRRIVGNVAF